MAKPILCLDFDGVIHSYTSGWKGATNIPDDPVPGSIEFMTDALMVGYDVVIHSSRARHLFGIMAMRTWLRKHAGNLWDTLGPSLCEVRFVRMKPSAFLTIDDRAMRFTGNFSDFPVEQLLSIKPWNKS